MASSIEEKPFDVEVENISTISPEHENGALKKEQLRVTYVSYKKKASDFTELITS
jgi:hypothetical protein